MTDAGHASTTRTTNSRRVLVRREGNEFVPAVYPSTPGTSKTPDL